MAKKKAVELEAAPDVTFALAAGNTVRGYTIPDTRGVLGMFEHDGRWFVLHVKTGLYLAIADTRIQAEAVAFWIWHKVENRSKFMKKDKDSVIAGIGPNVIPIIRGSNGASFVTCLPEALISALDKDPFLMQRKHYAKLIKETEPKLKVWEKRLREEQGKLDTLSAAFEKDYEERSRAMQIERIELTNAQLEFDINKNLLLQAIATIADTDAETVHEFLPVARRLRKIKPTASYSVGNSSRS